MAWIEVRELKGRRRKHGPPPKPRKVYRVGWRDPSGTIKVRTFDSASDAKRYARDVEVRKDRGEYADPTLGKVTLGEFLAHFDATATNIRPTTRAKYETLGRLYLAGEGLKKTEGLGDQPLRAITRADVRRFLAGLASDEGKGAPTVEAVARLLHRVLEVAVSEDRIARNPAHGVSVKASDRREPRFLTEKEIGKIAAKIPERYRALVWTLALAGLRIGEASALRVKHLDLKPGTIRVAESSAEVRGQKVTGPTKSRQARTVSIPPALAAMLKGHLETHGNRFDPESYVFTSERGGQVRQNAFRKRIFQPAAEAAKITPTPTVHDLRHSAASFYGRAGFTLLEAAQQLGHSTVTMTERYSHVFPETREEKVGRLDGLLG